VISTDLDELLDLCGRILVLSRGRIVGEVENGPKAGERVGELMVGAGDVAAA
jgi:simple sugar transport system ATP-binding protein